MPGDDDAPISSYSDPLYDRLDAMARQVKRMWWIFALGLAVVVTTSIAIRLWFNREPAALGAALAIAARDASDDKRADAWKALADGAGNDPGFRAAACIELAQIHLSAGDAIKARERANQAEALAREAKDDDLRLAALLSLAAIAADGNDFTGALDQYEKCSRSAGATYQARRMAAELGAARCLEKLGRIDDALQRLEPLTTRSDSGAGQLIDLATATYWRLKRLQATPKTEAKPAEPAKVEAKPAAEAKPAEPAKVEAKPAAEPVPAKVEAKPAAEPVPAKVEAKPAEAVKPTAPPTRAETKPTEPAKH